MNAKRRKLEDDWGQPVTDVSPQRFIGRGVEIGELKKRSVEGEHRLQINFALRTESYGWADAEDIDGDDDEWAGQKDQRHSAAMGRRLIGLGCVATGYAHARIVSMERGLLEDGSVGVGRG